jgi:hypothetical protein
MDLLTLLFPAKYRHGTPLERKSLGSSFLGIMIVSWLALIFLVLQLVLTFPTHTLEMFGFVSRSLIVLDATLYLTIFRTGLTGRKALAAWVLCLCAYCIWLIVSLG